MYDSSTDEEAKLSVLPGEFQLFLYPEMLITDHQWRNILESSFQLPLFTEITLSRD